MSCVHIDYFSDVLCIWAYGGQIRIDRLKQAFGSDVVVKVRFVSVFGDAQAHVRSHGPGDDGYISFSEHLKAVASRWDHIALHPDLWTRIRPRTSVNAHLYLKAAQCLLAKQDPRPDPPELDRFVWQVREAFFKDGRDVGHCRVLDDLAQANDFDPAAIRELIENGEAQAALHQDTEARDKQHIAGSPTLIMNGDRQRLYGNVGYRVMEANIKEILRRPEGVEASWC